MALDERLRRQLEEAGRPADPSGVYEDLIRRRERRRMSRRIQSGALAVVVIVGTVAGVLALSKLFHPATEDAIPPLVPAQPTASVNGLIAFTNGDRIVVQAADGANARDIPSPAEGRAWHLAWSPDGTQLAVAIFRDPGRSLWVIRPDGSEARMIAEGDNVSRPSWHPDGIHLVYSLERGGMTEVHVTRSDGTGDRVVYSEEAPGTYAVFSASFSPDGSQIVFDAGTDVGFDIFSMDADGSNVRQITRTGTDYNPSWSPDGDLILFTRQEGTSTSDIFVMKADGSSVRRLTESDGSSTNLNPVYSPDGTLITYSVIESGAVGSIVVMTAGGSDARTLIDGEVLGFSWQPVPLPDQPIPPTTGEDIGLGFPVCNVSSIGGHFVSPDAQSRVFAATRAGDTGDCPQADDAFNVVALDVDRDGLADASYGPIECVIECRVFSAPDVDGDGTDELLVVQSGGSVVGLRLYDFTLSEVAPSIVPVTVAEPGDPDGGFEPGAQPTIYFGGDGFGLNALQCGDVPVPDGPGVVATSAESLPHDSPDAEWHAHQTTLVLRDDGQLHVVDIRDFVEPITEGPEGPSFLSGERLCGSNLGP